MTYMDIAPPNSTSNDTKKFDYFKTDNLTIIEVSKICEKEGHTQQVAYSTYHGGVTQVCFTEKVIRSTFTWREKQ